jgi:2-isopropylmalate synthase
VLGKHSGRHAVQKCLERFGLSLNRRDIDEVYRRMVALADVQKHISDDDVVEIAVEVSGTKPVRTGEAGAPRTSHRFRA